ncbi:MAG: 30S ribosomal protein S4 [Candidatus Bilamarchaeaceae archaeon]
MGDPRKLKNKYERPKRLWETSRLAEESALKKEYCLKNMRELWIMNQELKKVRREARRLQSASEEERSKRLPELMEKLNRLGILGKGTKLEDILSLSIRDILERRLQTRVCKRGIAKSMAQARQLITHGFIAINGRKVSSPSYLVKAHEEDKISLYKNIDLSVSERAAGVEREKAEKKEGRHKAEGEGGEEAEEKIEVPKELDLPPEAEKVVE